MIAALLALTLFAMPTALDKAGREAHNALRDFQTIVLTEAQTNQTWPSPDELADITAKLAIARECIDDSLTYGVPLKPGAPVPPQLLSMLRSEVRAVAGLNGDVGPNAPKAARKAINRVQDAFAKLFALFPVGQEFYEHPPKP
jgi:hypothetical protein